MFDGEARAGGGWAPSAGQAEIDSPGDKGYGPPETDLRRRGLLRRKREGENEGRSRRRRAGFPRLSWHDHLRAGESASFVLRHHGAARGSGVLRGSRKFRSPWRGPLSLLRSEESLLLGQRF